MHWNLARRLFAWNPTGAVGKRDRDWRGHSLSFLCHDVTLVSHRARRFVVGAGEMAFAARLSCRLWVWTAGSGLRRDGHRPATCQGSGPRDGCIKSGLANGGCQPGFGSNRSIDGRVCRGSLGKAKSPMRCTSSNVQTLRRNLAVLCTENLAYFLTVTGRKQVCKGVGDARLIL